jgi:hypothetical protein
MANRHTQGKSKPSPENRRKTAEANLARGQTFRFKPGQSGNPGGRPRTAKLSEACRAKLASPIPGDTESRSYAEAIADKLAQLASRRDIRAAQELADRAEGRPSQTCGDCNAPVIRTFLPSNAFTRRIFINMYARGLDSSARKNVCSQSTILPTTTRCSSASEPTLGHPSAQPSLTRGGSVASRRSMEARLRYSRSVLMSDLKGSRHSG